MNAAGVCLTSTVQLAYVSTGRLSPVSVRLGLYFLVAIKSIIIAVLTGLLVRQYDSYSCQTYGNF